jgi:hypothetical protein
MHSVIRNALHRGVALGASIDVAASHAAFPSRRKWPFAETAQQRLLIEVIRAAGDSRQLADLDGLQVALLNQDVDHRTARAAVVLDGDEAPHAANRAGPFRICVHDKVSPWRREGRQCQLLNVG